jgi:hypothetical protein
MQEARERKAFSPDEYHELCKFWSRVDRKLAKLESQVKPPPVEASFSTSAAEEDAVRYAMGDHREESYEREPGADD